MLVCNFLPKQVSMHPTIYTLGGLWMNESTREKQKRRLHLDLSANKFDSVQLFIAPH